MLNYLINLLKNKLNEFLFQFTTLLLMGSYTQLEGVEENEEPLTELQSKSRHNSKKEQVYEYLEDNPKEPYFDTPYSVDAECVLTRKIARKYS